MQSGVAINVSNSNQPPAILSITSSAPASSAPAALASSAFVPLAITQTLTSLPRPAGNTTVERTSWSALFTSIPRRMWHSTVSSNFTVASDISCNFFNASAADEGCTKPSSISACFCCLLVNLLISFPFCGDIGF